MCPFASEFWIGFNSCLVKYCLQPSALLQPLGDCDSLLKSVRIRLAETNKSTRRSPQGPPNNRHLSAFPAHHWPPHSSPDPSSATLWQTSFSLACCPSRGERSPRQTRRDHTSEDCEPAGFPLRSSQEGAHLITYIHHLHTHPTGLYGPGFRLTDPKTFPFLSFMPLLVDSGSSGKLKKNYPQRIKINTKRIFCKEPYFFFSFFFFNH